MASGLFLIVRALYEKGNCVTPNPYAPPQAEVADIAGERNPPPLWNPNAAANWSLLFSPAFGAFLHMKNWQALGQPNKATSAKVWFVLSLVVLARRGWSKPLAVAVLALFALIVIMAVLAVVLKSAV